MAHRDFDKQPITKEERLSAVDEAIRLHSRGALTVGSPVLEALRQVREIVERHVDPEEARRAAEQSAETIRAHGGGS